MKLFFGHFLNPGSYFFRRAKEVRINANIYILFLNKTRLCHPTLSKLKLNRLLPGTAHRGETRGGGWEAGQYGHRALSSEDSDESGYCTFPPMWPQSRTLLTQPGQWTEALSTEKNQPAATTANKTRFPYPGLPHLKLL